MDPVTAKLALKLQLDDIDVVLKSLRTSSGDIRANDEAAAFRALRNELVTKWMEVNGQCAAINILREEHAN